MKADNGIKYNHLWHMENTEENRHLIKILNKSMKQHKSLYKLRLKYRKPKPGHKYGWGGSLKRDNALAFAVYINGSSVCDAERSNINKQIRELSRRNTLLMNLIYHIDTSLAKEIETVVKNHLQRTSNRAFAINVGEKDELL